MAFTEMAKYFTLFTPEGKGIYGELDDNGIVTFAIHAGEGSSIRGTEMFNLMMADYGSAVIAIRGVWHRSSLGHASTNIDKVNELTALGVRLEDAVAQAWTVTRAKKLGFNRVTVVGDPVGSLGSFERIEVLIEP